MRKIIYYCLLILFVTSCQKSREQHIEEEAKDMTKMCPITIDEATTLDSMTYSKTDNTINYYYSLGGELDNFDKINPLKSKIVDKQLETIRNSVELRKYKEWGVSFKYVYHSMTTKRLLLSMKFTKEQYQ